MLWLPADVADRHPGKGNHVDDGCYGHNFSSRTLKHNNPLLFNRFHPPDGSDHSAANIKALF